MPLEPAAGHADDGGSLTDPSLVAALRQSLAAVDGNPHHALGYGGNADLLVVGRQAVRDAVLERIGLLGCCGKA